MASFVYCLCAVASAVCAVLLTRSYARTRIPLLLWGSLCFSLLLLSNALLVVDLAILPETDLLLARTFASLAGVSVMLFGLIMESRS